MVGNPLAPHIKKRLLQRGGWWEPDDGLFAFQGILKAAMFRAAHSCRLPLPRDPPTFCVLWDARCLKSSVSGHLHNLPAAAQNKTFLTRRLLERFLPLMVSPSSTPRFFGSLTWKVPLLGTTDSVRQTQRHTQVQHKLLHSFHSA